MKKIISKVFLIFISVISLMLYQMKYFGTIASTYQSEKLVCVNQTNKNTYVTIEDYLIGVISSEMPLSYEDEALKAQVVASRTFVLSRNLNVDDSEKSQVYSEKDKLKDKWGNQYSKNVKRITNLIEETNNEVIYYNDQFISALFFSSSNGKTNNSEDYFTSSLPYLRSVDSHWDSCKENEYRKTYSKKELQTLLEIKDFKINDISYYSNKSIKNIKINNTVYSGRTLREKLSLSSSTFKIIKDKDDYTFISYGNGHGVGMSQYGANEMAKQGYDYKEILKHYYQNVEIRSIDLT